MQALGSDGRSDRTFSAALLESLEALVAREGPAAAQSFDKDRGLGAATRAYFFRTRTHRHCRPAAGGTAGGVSQDEVAATPTDVAPDADIWWAAVWTSFLNLPGASVYLNYF